jgi:hypothetical protein
LAIINRDEFPDGFFASTPHLPSCGVNTTSSRSWVEIFGDNNRVFTFCALKSLDDLDKIWFFVSWEDISPLSVYMRITDRECNNSYISNILQLPEVSRQ